MNIGIFDSGVGGEAVAAKIHKLLPMANITLVNDRKHMPYGSRSKKEIIQLTEKAIQPLLNNNYNAIVIACNTATTVAISYLRKKYPNMNFVGIEPMIKPASKMTKKQMYCHLRYTQYAK